MYSLLLWKQEIVSTTFFVWLFVSILSIWVWVRVAASWPRVLLDLYSSPSWGDPKASPCQMGYIIPSPVLGLPWGLLTVGHARKTPAGRLLGCILIRFPNQLRFCQCEGATVLLYAPSGCPDSSCCSTSQRNSFCSLVSVISFVQHSLYPSL